MSRYPGSYDDRGDGKAADDIGRGLPGSRDPDDVLSETGSVITDLDEQAANLEDGLDSMPLDIARDSVLRWADTLRSLGDDRLDRVAVSLGELSQALDAPTLTGARIGGALARVALDVRAVAAHRSGPLAFILDRLADVLLSSGQSLQNDVH